MNAILRVDLALCAGAGLCQSMSPDLFGESRSGRPDGRERTLHDPDLIELADDVAACCPAGAVRLDVAPSSVPQKGMTMTGTELPDVRSGEAVINDLWERNYDPPTMRIIEDLSVQPDWNCLDLGAGAGSMSYWLAGRVAQGTVLAVDVDTSQLDPQRAANLTVKQVDLAVDGLAEGAFDLILARAVFSQLPDPDKALARAVRWLAPGGWIVVEDFYFMPSDDSPTSYGRAVVDAYVKAFQTHGVDSRWARRIPARLAQAGLSSVGSTVRTLGPGQGAQENALMHARLTYQGAPLVENNLVSAADLEEFMVSLDKPEAQDVTTLMFSAWGRRAP
jgi:trans-aconitate methyltransferase/ferredoxin